MLEKGEVKDISFLAKLNLGPQKSPNAPSEASMSIASMSFSAMKKQEMTKAPVIRDDIPTSQSMPNIEEEKK